MRASLSTINAYNAQFSSAGDLLALGKNELIRLATNRLGGLEGSIDFGTRFEGVLVVRVVTVEKHPNADTLHVCMIDAGGVRAELKDPKTGLIQVVCGAPNIAEGQLVVWIPPGVAVPKSYEESEPFVLTTRDLRGVASNGMLASPSELGVSDSHDGILVLSQEMVDGVLPEPGQALKDLYGLNDFVLDFENKMFTHRPDCFGQLGLARELAAISGMAYTSPDWYMNRPEFATSSKASLSVSNQAPKAVPRFMAVVMEGVVVGESPLWLQAFITRMGGRPINNVVDLSNYIMHLSGQPTHAYDLDKLSGGSLGARYAQKGERLTLLNGKDIELIEEDLVIVDGKGAIGVAGIMGGQETQVTKNTTRIVLEVANFDMYTIRRTAMRHGLFTDAFTRFSKGQSPLQNDRVLYQFMKLLEKYVRAQQASDVYDVCDEDLSDMIDKQYVHEPVSVTAEFINARLGTDLGVSEIAEILQRVEMKAKESDGGLLLSAPFWRTDIQLKEDIVEEIGRIYGFDRLALSLPKRYISPAPRSAIRDFRSSIRHYFSARGGNEVLSYSFVHGNVLSKAGLDTPEDWCYHIRNALSPDLQYYRPALVPGMLTKIQHNMKSDRPRNDDNECVLFELGKVHIKGSEQLESEAVDPREDKQALPEEFERLAFVVAADDKTAQRNYGGSAYYQAKQYIDKLTYGQAEYRALEETNNPLTSPYQPGRAAMVYIGDEMLGVAGELKQSVRESLKLPYYCAAAELDVPTLMSCLAKPSYRQMTVYPKTQQDITLSVGENTMYEDLRSNICSTLDLLAHEAGYHYEIHPRDIYSPDGSTKNMTYRLWLWHNAKTLKTEEVNTILAQISDDAQKTINAKRV